MNISLDQWRAVIGLFNALRLNDFRPIFNLSMIFWVLLFLAFIYKLKMACRECCIRLHSFLRVNINSSFFMTVLLLLLLQAGDIERNPGPSEIPQDLAIAHLNIRSIRNKLDYIRDNFLDFDILCFSETHLDDLVPLELLKLENFDEPYRKDRTNHGGGVLMYLNSCLAHKRRPDLETYCDESIWVQLQGRDKYLIGTFYSPKTADVNFFNNFSLNIEKALEVSKNIIIVGDLNEDLNNRNFHNLSDILIVNSLINTVISPTRQQALLDPIIVPDDVSYLDSGTIDIPEYISDHKATYIIMPTKHQRNISYTRLVWLYKRADFESLKSKIDNFDWYCLLQGTLDEATELFTSVFLKFVKQCIPSKNVTIRGDDKPWYDSEIRSFTRKRDKQKRKAIKTGNSNDWSIYKHLRNKVNNLKKHAKELFFNNLELSINDFFDNDKKKFWKIIRHFVKDKDSSSLLPPILDPDNTNQNKFGFLDSEKAEILNKYFVSISTVDDSTTHLPNSEQKCQNLLSSIECSPDEIESLIKLLNVNKATGPDIISNKMLKPVSKEISLPLSILFNRSFREGKFANLWKRANVLPLFKQGDKSLPSNYRPVSLLSGVGKIQEKLVFKHIYNHMNDNNLLYKYQSGFLPSHSTTFQLLDIYHHICQSFDNNQYSCMVFCDLSKAFDRVWHKGLIFKLKQYGINGELLNWIIDYLNDRQQRVIVKGHKSDYKPVTAGVPQGSVLGPLLFLIYINDIADSLLSLTRLFADDSSLYYSASSIADIEGIINHDLQLLAVWAKQWLIKFNPLKTETILFTHETAWILSEHNIRKCTA